MELVCQGPLVFGGRDAVRPPDDLIRELFEQYYQPVVAFFARRGFADEAADLAQETFTRAFQNLGTLRGRDNPRPWLFAVAINVWRNAVRSRKAAKRTGEETPFDEAVEPAVQRAASANPGGDAEEDALEKILTREREELLRQALDELPPRMRQAVLLRVGRDLKYREIAEIQQVTVDTIKAQMLQARKKLRERLGEHFSNIDF